MNAFTRTSSRSPNTLNGNRYALVIVDDFPRFAWLTTMPYKDGPTAAKAFSTLLASLAVKYTPHRVVRVRSDQDWGIHVC